MFFALFKLLENSVHILGENKAFLHIYVLNMKLLNRSDQVKQVLLINIKIFGSENESPKKYFKYSLLCNSEEYAYLERP